MLDGYAKFSNWDRDELCALTNQNHCPFSDVELRFTMWGQYQGEFVLVSNGPANKRTYAKWMQGDLGTSAGYKGLWEKWSFVFLTSLVTWSELIRYQMTESREAPRRLITDWLYYFAKVDCLETSERRKADIVEVRNRFVEPLRKPTGPTIWEDLDDEGDSIS